MTRSKRFFAGVITGYGSIVANVVFTLVSIPLALHFLDKEHFGLWALAAQINGYLALLELGMGNAINRYIADHKDEVNGGKYGSHLLTSGLVFITQGLLIAGLGIGLSWFAPTLFSIPAHLAEDFRCLLMLLAGISGLSVATRSVGSPLWAFQRMDVINLGFTLGTLSSLVALWFGFSKGWGVTAFAYSQLPAALGAPVIHWWVCRRKGYYPVTSKWGKPSLAIFKQIFHFGKDMLLIQLGSQLVNASQIMIISRAISLEAAATFAVSTKLYTMGMRLLANPVSVATPGLTELYVRGDRPQFVKRYWHLIAITVAASTFVATGIAAGNRSFVSIWTQGNIDWPWMGDLLLALLLVLRTLNGGFLNLFGVIKDWRPVRFTYLAEGLVFVPLAIFLAPPYGITGVLGASLIAHLLTTTVFSARAASRIIGSTRRLSKNLMVSSVMVAAAATLNWRSMEISASPILVLAATSALCICALGVAWQVILPGDMRREVRNRMLLITRKFKIR